MNLSNSASALAGFKRTKLFQLVAASTIGLASINTGMAADQNDSLDNKFETAASTLEEVIVVARRRTENLQSVPIAVSVMSKDMIDTGQLYELDKMITLVPNATFSTDSWTASEIAIRGSGRNSSDEDPSVGIFRDGIYIGGLVSSTANFYDIAQVEVLRGPQAGLYGRNAVGGAMNVTSVRPEHEFGGYVDIQIASEDRQELRGAINLPVEEESIALRLSGLYINQDEGFEKVPALDHYQDAEENKSARLQILWEPNKNWEFLTTIDSMDVKNSPGGIVIAPDEEGGYADSAQTLWVPGSTADDTGNLQRNFADIRDFEQIHAYQEVNYQTDFGTWTWLLSHRSADLDLLTDRDATQYSLMRQEFDASQDSTIGEFRFASREFNGFRFTAGITVMKDETVLNNENLVGGEFGFDLESMYAAGVVTESVSAATGIPVGLPIEFLGLTPFATGWTGELGDSFPTQYINEQETESVAVFFEGYYTLSEQWELWGNLRYTSDDKSITFAQGFGSYPAPCPVACPEIFAVFFDGLDPEIGASASETFDNFSPGGGVNYQINDDIMAYAKLVTGFKAGGFNSISGSIENLPFEEETTISYEIGAKTQWLGGRLKANIAAFSQKREDALVEINDPFMPIAFLGVNAGEIRNEGLEFDLSAHLFEGLKLDIAAGYLDSEFEDFVTFGVDFSGNKTPRVFKYSLSAVLNYERSISNGMALFGYLSYSNAWDGYTDHDNFQEMDKPELMDLRLGLRSEKWSVVGYVDNVLDNRYRDFETNATQLDGTHFGTFAPGQTYGIRLTYDF